MKTTATRYAFFTKNFKTNLFNAAHQLARFLSDNNITTLLDIGCGNCKWQQNLLTSNIAITGVDIVPYIAWNKPPFPIFTKDAVCDNIEGNYDAVIIRDVLQYLPAEDCRRLITNVAKNISRFIIVNHAEDNYTLNAKEHSEY